MKPTAAMRSPFAIMQRMRQGNAPTTPREIHHLQQTIGNAAVTRLMQRYAQTTPQSTAPLQRISTEDADAEFAAVFDANVLSAVGPLVKKWISNLKLDFAKISKSTMKEIVNTFHLNFDDAFEQWLSIQPDSKNKVLLLPLFVKTMNAPVTLLEYVIQQGLVTADFKKLEVEGEDDEYEMSDDEIVEEDDVDTTDADEDMDVPEPTKEELLAIAATGKSVEALEARKAKSIEDVGKSDGDFKVVPLATLRKAKAHLKAHKESFQFDTKKKGEARVTHTRPKDAGVTTILTETFTQPYMNQKTETARTVYIEAEVIPMATTGRLGAPEPDSQLRVGESAKLIKPRGTNATNDYRNQGFKDAQKGHIIALELGGPDVPKNIVPQWANWQANGLWRKMEDHVLAMAESLKKSSRLQMRVEVHYKAAAGNTQASFRSLAFPSHFTVQAWEIDAKTKEPISGQRYQKTLDAAQDHTDDMLMYREDDGIMKKAGQESPYLAAMLQGSKGKKAGGATKRAPRKRAATTTRAPRKRAAPARKAASAATRTRRKVVDKTPTPPKKQRLDSAITKPTRARRKKEDVEVAKKVATRVRKPRKTR